MKNSNPPNQALWKTRIWKIIETPALKPCHNHRGKAPLTPASGLPIPSPKTGLTTQKLTAAQVPGNYKFKLPG